MGGYSFIGYIAPNIEDKYILLKSAVVPGFLRLVDKTAIELKNFVTGANESGYHVIGANWVPLCRSGWLM